MRPTPVFVTTHICRQHRLFQIIEAKAKVFTINTELFDELVFSKNNPQPYLYPPKSE